MVHTYHLAFDFHDRRPHARMVMHQSHGRRGPGLDRTAHPTPKAGEVLVEIKAASLNFPDL